jgi:hypothetical protein
MSRRYWQTSFNTTSSTNMVYLVFFLLKSLPPRTLQKSVITDHMSVLIPSSISLNFGKFVCPLQKQLSEWEHENHSTCSWKHCAPGEGQVRVSTYEPLCLRGTSVGFNIRVVAPYERLWRGPSEREDRQQENLAFLWTKISFWKQQRENKGFFFIFLKKNPVKK